MFHSIAAESLTLDRAVMHDMRGVGDLMGTVDLLAISSRVHHRWLASGKGIGSVGKLDNYRLVIYTLWSRNALHCNVRRTTYIIMTRLTPQETLCDVPCEHVQTPR